MTNIEFETLCALKSAAWKYTKETGIDWEQRRYEIAKDVLCGRLAAGSSITDKDEFAETCVGYADLLIKYLKTK